MGQPPPPPRAQGHPLDPAPEAFGAFADSTDALGDADELRHRLSETGYVFLPGYLDRGLALNVRAEVLRRLKSNGHLHCARPMLDGYAARDTHPKWMPDLVRGNAVLHRLLYAPAGPMMRLYERLLGGAVRHFDHTWMRTIGPGEGTPPHCDSVYMGRGSSRLHTSWVPLGDLPIEVGGLLLLEGSNNHERLRNGYGQRDVDTFCENRLAPGERPRDWSGPVRDGWLSRDPARLGKAMRRRWLTAPPGRGFLAGDVVVFTVYTVHGSLDNQTDRLRLSADARYQPADDPADERWVGTHPKGHGGSMSRGVIC